MKEYKTAIVTGAARGIGLSVADCLLRHGRQVMMVDVNEVELRQAHAVLSAHGQPVACCACDISDQESVANMISSSVARFDSIDILVNNAAMTYTSSVSTTSNEDWNKVQSVNLAGAYNCVQQSLKYLKYGGEGSIVNITSIQGMFGQQFTSAYSAAKGGLIAMTKSMAVEFGEFNIRVNAVAPGFIETQMSYSEESGKYEHEEDNFQKVYIEHGKLPLRRTGYPNDVAGPVHFLTSSQSAYVTGQVIVVDGGVTSTY